MAGMKKTWLWFRIIAEFCIGGCFCLGALISLPSVLPAMAHHHFGYAIKAVARALLMGYFGFWIIKDAMKVYSRVLPTRN
jgi:hypothetical protein